jgi:apolipoprotein N-acyltransferase
MKLFKKISFLVVILLLSALSNGQYSVFFIIWIFIPVLLFAVRKLKRWQGFLLAFFVIATGYYIGFDVVPFLPLAASITISAIFGLLAALPYLIDSFFTKGRNSFVSTLIFPTSVVLIEYLYHQLNAYGTWGHFAYTQESQSMLLQSISLFGLGYITFLIAWFGSVINWLYEQRNSQANLRKGALVYGSVLAITILFGSYRVAYQESTAETVRIASISPLDSLHASIDIQGINTKETAVEAIATAKKSTTELNQYLLDKSISEANAGAKVVFWAEGASVILKEDEAALYNQASHIAKNNNIYLGIAVAVIDPSNAKFLENKFVMFNKKGEKVMDYWKGISVPGAETSISNNKAVGIQKIDTEYGTIAGAICFDLDFPNYLRQAKGADILLSPSNDWKEIDPIHTNMTKVRAIEQGFNFIRQTTHGRSVGTDYTGKVLSEMDHFTDRSKVMITQLPTQGTMTLYSIIGDSFIAFCLLVFMTVAVILKRKKSTTKNTISSQTENENILIGNPKTI